MNKTKTVLMGDREINNFCKPYIIAEIGANHNGSMKLAKKLIRQAKKAGVDSAKFQSWSKKNLFSKSIYEKNKTLEKQLDEWSLDYTQLTELKKTCEKEKIDFSCTPISKQGVDFFVDKLNVKFIKIASMDLNNLPFLKYVASKNKPIILSTGLGSYDEIKEAVNVITKRNNNLILLHCVSIYPPKINHINLNNIDMLREKFELPVGFSDHFPDETFSLAAVAKGACVIERHFTLDKKMDGWDHNISSDLEGMKNLVKKSKLINQSLGSYNRIIYADDEKQKKGFRRSVTSKRNLKKGEIIKRDDLIFKRPGIGIPPDSVNKIIGKRVINDIPKNSIIFYENINLKFINHL